MAHTPYQAFFVQLHTAAGLALRHVPEAPHRWLPASTPGQGEGTRLPLSVTVLLLNAQRDREKERAGHACPIPVVPGELQLSCAGCEGMAACWDLLLAA